MGPGISQNEEPQISLEWWLVNHLFVALRVRRWMKDEGVWVVSLAILQLVRPKVSAWVNKALEVLTSLAMVDMVDWKTLISCTKGWKKLIQQIGEKYRGEASKLQNRSKQPRHADWSRFYICQHRFSCSSGRWRWLWIVSTLPDDLGRHPKSMRKVDLQEMVRFSPNSLLLGFSMLS